MTATQQQARIFTGKGHHVTTFVSDDGSGVAAPPPPVRPAAAALTLPPFAEAGTIPCSSSASLSGHSAVAEACVAARDGRHVYTCAPDRRVVCSNATTGAPRALFGTNGAIELETWARALAVWDREPERGGQNDPDGALFVATSAAPLGHDAGATLSSGGAAAGGAVGNGLIRQFSLRRGEFVASFAGHVGSVRTLALEHCNAPPTRRRAPRGAGGGGGAAGAPPPALLSGGDDAIVRRWDIETATCTLAHHGHSGAINCIASGLISGSGPTRPVSASGSNDGTVTLWDSRTAH
jgi:WD40 repeat protein